MSAELPGIEDWRKLVLENLKGRDVDSLRSKTRDGIVTEPLYEAARDAQPLLGRGAGPWIIVQPIDDPDPDRANEQARADIKGGARGLSLSFAGQASDPSPGLPPTRDALQHALDGVDPAKIHLWLEPHPQQLETARSIRDHVLSTGVAPELAFVAFGLNPFSAIASERLPSVDSRAYTQAFKELRASAIFGSVALLDARPFHEAGATEGQELAVVLAELAWWLRTLDDAGIEIDEILPYFAASLCVDRDLLLSVAKMRALQLVRARFAEVCGEARWHLNTFAQTSRRMLARADPHTNLLRNTLAAFAAAVGGADEILVLPHSTTNGVADRDARALARNIQHLLISEAHIANVADPGAGSGAIEALSEELAERAWAEFQEIEREGGIVTSLVTGSLQQRIAKARTALVREVADGTAPLVGSTVYGVAPDPAFVGSHTDAISLRAISLEAMARALA